MNMMMYFLIVFPIFVLPIIAFPYEFSNVYESDNRPDPDAIFHGFFPHWGLVLLILSGVFLVIAAAGLVGYLIGCRTPPPAHHSSTASNAPLFVVQNLTKVL